MAQLDTHITDFLSQIPSNGVAHSPQSGQSAAANRLQTFINSQIHAYAIARNNPSHDAQSGLSPYLHFGQISALQILHALREHSGTFAEELHIFKSPKMPKGDESAHATINGANALLEELIVRKELADNLCFYAESYRALQGAPQWAQKSLAEHEADAREFTYSRQQFEAAQTHDTAWNAAQIQLCTTGKMHGYMRMYWAKKVLEWSPTASEAIRNLIYLNDFYSLDGGDPNGYTGILWSVGGVHDRPWTERPIFGKIRYMNYEGLKRKFKIDQYEAQWLRRSTRAE